MPPGAKLGYVVRYGMTLAGDVADFDEAGYKSWLAAKIGGVEPTLTVTAATSTLLARTTTATSKHAKTATHSMGTHRCNMGCGKQNLRAACDSRLTQVTASRVPIVRCGCQSIHCPLCGIGIWFIWD